MTQPAAAAPAPPEPWPKVALRGLLAAAMVSIGVAHFTSADAFVSIMPPYLPAHLLLVHVSGVAEIGGGVGLLIPRLRRAAGWGLIALYLAVFPANIHMALNDVPLNGVHAPSWALWLRLPLQAVFIAWAWWVALARPRRQPRA